MLSAQGQRVADAFGLGRVRAFRYAADGMMAQVWRMDTITGSYAVKEFGRVPDRYELHARLEHAAQLADAAARAGVCTPRSVRSPAGDLLLSLTDDAHADCVYVTVAAWIQGRSCKVTRDADSAAHWLGETVAAIELIPDPPDAPALDAWLERLLTVAPTETQWRTALDQAERSRRPWAQLLKSRLRRLIDLGSIVIRPSDGGIGLMHTDLQPKNVLVTSTGFALLDWDDAALCSRDHMLARVIIEWLTPGGIDTDAIIRFMRAYRDRGGTGTIHDLSDFSYAAAAFLNYIYETITSDLTSNGEYQGSTGHITAALAHPLDTPTLERVRDVIQYVP